MTGRSSLRERERVVRRLRTARVDDRISQDTFVRRLDLAFAARTRNELEWLVADLADVTWATRAITAVSRLSAQLGAAWREPRTPHLPFPVTGDLLMLGRSSRCGCVLADPSVSRLHASLRREHGRWWLHDECSTNGTWVNGRRVVVPVEVRAGDEVVLGRTRLVLA